MMRNCIRILMVMIGMIAAAGMLWLLISGTGNGKTEPDGTLVQLMRACGVPV